MRGFKQVILVLVAVLLAASAGIDFTGRNNVVSMKDSSPARSNATQRTILSWYPGKSFCNCGTGGNITNIDITKCEEPPCSFQAGEELSLQFDYITDYTFAKLDLNISLVDQESGDVILLKHTTSSIPVDACVTKSTFTVFTIDTTVPNGKTWYLEILRTYAGREVCARFPVYVFNNNETSSLRRAGGRDAGIFAAEATRGTLSYVKSQMFRFTPYEDFSCPGVGMFPDPSSCTKFHQCQYFPNGTLWDTVKECPASTVYCPESFICDYPTACPCDLPHC